MRLLFCFFDPPQIKKEAGKGIPLPLLASFFIALNHDAR